MTPPPLPRWLGLAGLLPQAAAVAVVLSGDEALRFSALALGYAYAALILSFLGGMWWGLAANAERPPEWMWVAAIAPSLMGLASAVPWAVGQAWPAPSLAILAVSLIAALLVDRLLVERGLAPVWWMSLRVPLSLGLGALTLILAVA